MKAERLDITNHHRKSGIQLKRNLYDDFLIDDVVSIMSGKNGWFSPHLVSESTYSVAFNRYLRYVNTALMLDWPQTHVTYLLAKSAELQKLFARVWAQGPEPIELSFEGLTIELEGVDSPRGEMLDHFLDAVSVNAIVRDQAGIVGCCDINENQFRYDVPALQPCEQVAYRVLQLFYLNEQDKTVQQDALDNLAPFLEEGVLRDVIFYPEFEDEFHCLYVSLCKIIEAIWQENHAEVEKAVRDAAQGNYLALAYILPSLNNETQGLSGYGDVNGLYHWHIMGIIAQYHDRTGNTLSFTSAYMPEWLLYQQGPRASEVMENPPVFSLETVHRELNNPPQNSRS